MMVYFLDDSMSKQEMLMSVTPNTESAMIVSGAAGRIASEKPAATAQKSNADVLKNFSPKKGRP